MRNEIGISLASYLPMSAFYPNFFLEKADETGYEFAGVNPRQYQAPNRRFFH